LWSAPPREIIGDWVEVGYYLADPFCHITLKAINSTTCLLVQGQIVPLKELGRYLKQWRMAKGVSMEKAAKLIGVCQPAICYWELEKCIPNRTNATKIATLLEGVYLLRKTFLARNPPDNDSE